MKDTNTIPDDGLDERPHFIVIDDATRTIAFESFFSFVNRNLMI